MKVARTVDLLVRIFEADLGWWTDSIDGLIDSNVARQLILYEFPSVNHVRYVSKVNRAETLAGISANDGKDKERRCDRARGTERQRDREMCRD